MLLLQFFSVLKTAWLEISLGGGSAHLITCMLLRAQIVKRLGPSEMVSQEIDSSVPILLFGNGAFRMSPQFKGALLLRSWCQKVPRAAEKRNFLDCPSKHYSSFLFMKRNRPISRVLVSESHMFALGMSGVHRFLQNSMFDVADLSGRAV